MAAWGAAAEAAKAAARAVAVASTHRICTFERGAACIDCPPLIARGLRSWVRE